MSDMKLIMEGWRSYVETLDYIDPKVYIIEGKENKTQKNLSVLFEESEKGLITEQEVLEIWRKSILYESEQLIEGKVMDKLSAGWQAIKKGGKWMTEKVMQAYKWAAEQFNNFIVNLWGGLGMKLTKAATSLKSNIYIASVLEDLNVLREKVLDFKSVHPVLWKFGSVMLVCGTLTMLLAAFGSEAQAAVVDGKEHLTEETMNGIKGVLSAACENDKSVCGAVARATARLSDHATALQGVGTEGGIDADQILDLSKKGMDDTDKILKLAKNWFGHIKDTVRDVNQEARDAMKAGGIDSPEGISPEDWYGSGGSEGIVDKVDLAKEMNADLLDIIEAGEKQTYRTLERIHDVRPGYERKAIKLGGDLVGKKLGYGDAKTFGEPMAQAIKTTTTKGQQYKK